MEIIVELLMKRYYVLKLLLKCAKTAQNVFIEDMNGFLRRLDKSIKRLKLRMNKLERIRKGKIGYTRVS